jgi:uncharacterized protein (DUF433 family)
MLAEYIEHREGSYYVAGTRISLDSIVYAFHRGDSPETICQNFELLNLEQVYGAIAYYLAHKSAVNSYLKQQDQKWVEDKQRSAPLPSGLREKLLRVREDLRTTRRS